MEGVAAMPQLQGEWGEEADFMAQLLGNCSVLTDTNFLVSPTTHESCWNVTETAMYSCDETNTNISGGSGEESYYSILSCHVSVTNNSLTTMDYCTPDSLRQDGSNDSTECNMKNLDLMPIPPQLPTQDKIISPSKRSRLPCDVPRNKKMKFNAKFEDDKNNKSNGVAVFQRQSSSSCCSEDESNEINGTSASCSTSKATRKTRTATDPQSLYARKRRERINERLKILQTLVPNGTKVDISTMLEEAVEYVKFLQLQIKLLSSDQHWMYAPIAYNGINIGLDFKMAIPKPQ